MKARYNHPLIALLVLVQGIFFFYTQNSFAQLVPSANQGSDPNVIRYEPITVPLSKLVIPSEIKEDWLFNVRNTRVISEPGVDVLKDEIRERKAEANKLYQESLMNGTVSNSSAKTTTLSAPGIGVHFFGNTYDGGIPNDNSLAVSKGGIVVSSTNSRIHCYNETGTQIMQASMGAFSSQAGITQVGGTIGSGLKFDPKVTYDPVADRFIWVWLNGAESSNSNIVMCFSKTNDPTDGWYAYETNGNVGPDDVWSDFPQIGLTTQELIITTNLFTDGGGSTGSAVWQVRLEEGYAGSPLTIGLNATNYFSLHPVEGGSTPTGPHAYLIRNTSSGGSGIALHKITNTFSASGVLNPPISLSGGPSYSVPASGDQPGSTPLNTNDCRIQSSYYENNRIIFAFNTSGSGGKPSIYLGEVELAPFDLSFSSMKGTIITQPDYHIAYPGVTYGGVKGTSGDVSTFLMFNMCSPTFNPGNGAVYISEDGEVSELAVLREGNAAMGSGTEDWRWGDYADIGQRHNNLGEAWVGGSYSWTSQGRTYVSQIFQPTEVGIQKDIVESKEMNIFPVPALDLVNFGFPVESTGLHTVSVYGMDGTLIRELETAKLKQGDAQLEFSTRNLAAGTYFVVVSKEGEVAFREKFVVAK